MSTIFINCGDPNGIGPEVTVKALVALPEKLHRRAILAGYCGSLEEINRLMGEPLTFERVQSIEDAQEARGIPIIEPEEAHDFSPRYGEISAEAGRICGRGIALGVAACLNGDTAALVTAPSSKGALHLAGFQYPGQTEMIGALCSTSRHIMILARSNLRVGLVTTHLALRDVTDVVRQGLVREKIALLQESIIRWFKIADPTIAVTALNPHASDGGLFGNEEEEYISPAIEDAREAGILVDGPFPADSLFSRWKDFDGILAMYHDQGLIPIKMAGFGKAINVTGGLPFLRTSPDHGTAFDIAGKLVADPGSMIRAIQAAFRLSVQ